MANGMTPSQRISASSRTQKYTSGDVCNQRSNGLRFQTSMAISTKNKKAPGMTRKQNVTMRRVSDRCRIASPPTPVNAKSNPRRALFSRGELGMVTPHCTNSDAQNFKVPDKRCRNRRLEMHRERLPVNGREREPGLTWKGSVRLFIYKGVFGDDAPRSSCPLLTSRWTCQRTSRISGELDKTL